MTEHVRLQPIELPQRFRWRLRPRPPTVREIMLGVVAFLLGVGGGLVYAWLFAPVPETDTEPHQLHRLARAEYMVAIILRWAADDDDGAAMKALESLQLGDDVAAAVAQLACELVGRGYSESGNGFRAIQQVVRFYQKGGASGCADALDLPAVAPALVRITALPDEPLATATPSGTVLPAPPSITRAFQLTRLETHCDPTTAGLIIVFVQEPNARGIRGQRLRASWDGGESDFVTGLHPDRDPGYADFAMQPGRRYRIEMPGQAPPSTSLSARSCQSRGRTLLRSYQLTYRPAK